MNFENDIASLLPTKFFAFRTLGPSASHSPTSNRPITPAHTEAAKWPTKKSKKATPFRGNGDRAVPREK